MNKLICATITAALILASQAYAGSDSWHVSQVHDCVQCHTLSKSEARMLLEKMFPDVVVLSVNGGPVKGLWEVMIEAGSRKGIVYVDYSKKKFISGAVIDMANNHNLTHESYYQLSKVSSSKLSHDDSLNSGYNDAGKE
jgi:hypothetical protein